MFDAVAGSWTATANVPLADSGALDVTAWRIWLGNKRYRVTAAAAAGGSLAGSATFDGNETHLPRLDCGAQPVDLFDVYGYRLAAWVCGCVAA